MTSKQADQNLADIASGEDVRSGTDGGASTKGIWQTRREPETRCVNSKRILSKNLTVSERE